VEVLVVDDGSTDDTAGVACSYAARVTYFWQANAGLSAARNTGIAQARTPWLVFLDADDALRPSMVERCLAEIQRLPAKFAVIGCGETIIDQAGAEVVRREFMPLVDHEVSARALIEMSRFSCAALVSRAAFAECGTFDPSLPSSEDRDMWIRVATRFRLFRVADSLVLRRVHGSNMSRHSARQSETKRRVIGRAFRMGVIPRWNIPFWLRVWSVYLFQSGLMYHDERAPFPAVVRLIGSILAWPWFADPFDIDQPRLFRLRAIARVLLRRP
jgi:glycosyltransferase involved in cell wall biosynthesis